MSRLEFSICYSGGSVFSAPILSLFSLHVRSKIGSFSDRCGTDFIGVSTQLLSLVYLESFPLVPRSVAMIQPI